MIVWGIVRTVGLRGLAGLLGWWLNPLGRAALLAGLALAGWVGLRAYWIHEGREAERAVFAEKLRQAEAAADSERAALERENAEAAARDAAELAAQKQREKEVRDANASGGGDVLWRADDPWLRSKSASGKGHR